MAYSPALWAFGYLLSITSYYSIYLLHFVLKVTAGLLEFCDVRAWASHELSSFKQICLPFVSLIRL